MYEVKQRGRNRWYVAVTDLATGGRSESPELKTWHDCGNWIAAHVRDAASNKQAPDRAIQDLLDRRAQLHSELVGASNPDRQWFRDRARELDYYNRQLDRLGHVARVGA